ncbi:MAG TPA: PD-(D/E)XK nuclease family protein [Holophagaceae bacterium]|nr:PD-(D/E)XK nuclease family protein [Holophagaceae bacterium]
MSHDPFDGVLLDDPRPPVPGAVSLMLHLRVARRLAKAHGRSAPGLQALRARAQACRELMAHGLLPDTLRRLPAYGLELGSPRTAHSLANLMAHLEAYLAEVEAAGYLEPEVALGAAVDRELAGHRGLWIERTAADGPLRLGLKDLAPVRLRAVACLPALDGATFVLATDRGDAGLFGSGQPLVEWFLSGLEDHGGHLPNTLNLEAPAGWGEAPWAPALGALFEAPLNLEDHRDAFQRGLVEGPLDLLRHAVEQVCAWLDAGIAPREMTLIHPDPAAIAPLLGSILAEEGVAVQVRGGLTPLRESPSWSPLWNLLTGLRRLDPCTVSAGLRASRQKDLRAWAEALAGADQNGAAAFEGSLIHLGERTRARAEGILESLQALRESVDSAAGWADRLEALAADLSLPSDSEAFYGPLNLLKAAWGTERWRFQEMLQALEVFLEAARSDEGTRASEGLRLLAPEALFEGWSGARATLILDLSEGAWPARPAENPDLSGDCKAAVNRALLAWSQAEAKGPFPPALQRFWLPRTEHGDQIPRAFQREAYAFSKALALTTERLVVLSPSQDEEGRVKAQGPFWNALEGAASWSPDPLQMHSRLRARWEAPGASAMREARAEATQARSAAEALQVEAPAFDRSPGLRDRWMKGRASVSPTALEGLATCPFRSLAERVWGLQTFDARSRLRMAVGTLAHAVLEAALTPFVGVADWPAAFREARGLPATAGPEDLLPHLESLWREGAPGWFAALRDLPEEQHPVAALEVEALLPNLSAHLDHDLNTGTPTKDEAAFLDPAAAPPAKGARPDVWTRTLLALEGTLGPVALPLDGGRTLEVDGKVDRLERWEHADGRRFLRVVDYKTSKEASLAAYAEEEAPFGGHLQLPLYMLLAEALHPGLPVTAALVPLREETPKPYTKPLRVLAEAGPEGAWREKLRANLDRLDARLETGDFPPTPGERCAQCELAALCGRPVDVDADREED